MDESAIKTVGSLRQALVSRPSDMPVYWAIGDGVGISNAACTLRDLVEVPDDSAFFEVLVYADCYWILADNSANLPEK